jgi:ribonucleoside-diphosphate reductase beta chain
MSIEEFLLDPQNSRNNIYPILYNDIWDMYKRSVAAFWVPDEIRLTDDIKDFANMDENERHFILTVLAFFANSDFIVNENLDTNFTENIQIPELKIFYHFAAMMEDIHTQSYQLMITALVPNFKESQALFDSIKTNITIKRKADWARKYIHEGNFTQRIVAFSMVEGIFFSGSFCSIFWCKKRGLMPGLCQANELIARDEGMHRDMACLVYSNYIQNKLDKSILLQMLTEAVSIEKEFIQDCLPYKLDGMNSDLMCQYIEFVADHLLENLISEKYYNVECPFPWMTLISMPSKGNFFERQISNYTKSGVMGDKNSNSHEICFDEDF